MRLLSEDPAFTRHDEDGLTFLTGEKLNWSRTKSSGEGAKIYVCDSEDAVVKVLGKHVRHCEQSCLSTHESGILGIFRQKIMLERSLHIRISCQHKVSTIR